MQKYTQDYFDTLHSKVDSVEKLMKPYMDISECLRDMYVIIEAYKICGTEVDYASDFEQIADRISSIVSEGENYLWRKESVWLDELLNE